MTAFRAVDGELHAEGVPLAVIAERFGTPCYVYSRAMIEGAYRDFAGALAAALPGPPPLVCYAMKANSNLAVLNLLARLGSGFDIVSGGELARVQAAGGDPARSSSPASARPRARWRRRSPPASCASTSSPLRSSTGWRRSPPAPVARPRCRSA